MLKVPKPLYVKFHQAILNHAYACSEGAFPFFFSCSNSRFAVANSSSDGIFTIIRYITFCQTNGQPSYFTPRTSSSFQFTHLPHHLLDRPLPSNITNRAPNQSYSPPLRLPALTLVSHPPRINSTSRDQTDQTPIISRMIRIRVS